MEGRGRVERSKDNPARGALIWDPLQRIRTRARTPYGQFSPFLSNRNRSITSQAESGNNRAFRKQ